MLFETSPRRRTPPRVPTTVPRPPNSGVPPMTTAAMARSSYPVPMFGRAEIENAGENHGAGTNDYTVERVQSNLDPPNRHAGQARRFFVASYGEAVSSKQRPLEKEISRNQYGQKYIDWARHAEQIAKPKDIEK